MSSYKEYEKTHVGVSWDKYVDWRFSAAEQALELAQRELNRRLEGMNEIRSQLDRQAAEFATKELLAARLEKLSEKIDILETDRAVAEGRNRVFAIIIAMVATIIGSTISGAVVYFITRG